MSLFDTLPPEVKAEAHELRSMAHDDLLKAIEDMNKWQGVTYLSATMDVCINVLAATVPKEVIAEYLEGKLRELKK